MCTVENYLYNLAVQKPGVDELEMDNSGYSPDTFEYTVHLWCPVRKRDTCNFVLSFAHASRNLEKDQQQVLEVSSVRKRDYK